MTKQEQINELRDLIMVGSRLDINSATTFAETLYKKGYRKQIEWISVDERLPPRRERVICYSPQRETLPIFMGCIGMYGGNWHNESGYLCMTPITHWMPLPEAPKMKGGAE